MCAFGHIRTAYGVAEGLRVKICGINVGHRPHLYGVAEGLRKTKRIEKCHICPAWPKACAKQNELTQRITRDNLRWMWPKADIIEKIQHVMAGHMNVEPA